MQDKWAILALFALVCGAILMAVCYGLLAIFWPRAAWYLREGWKFKGAEPSVWSLVMTRIGGLLSLIVIGLLLVFAAYASKASNRPPASVVKSSPMLETPTPR